MLVVIGLLGVGCSSTTYQIKSESGKVVNTVPSWFMADIKESKACDLSMWTKKDNNKVCILSPLYINNYIYGNKNDINVRGFKHSIEIIKGKYDNPNDIGQISHFQALTSALSATIGLGNIAGVAIAVTLGGPGAVFWMVFIAFFSMSAKFVSATLGLMYRKVNDDGSVSGGPMYYLTYGFKNKGNLSYLGKILGVM